jgi:hypothetical protein
VIVSCVYASGSIDPKSDYNEMDNLLFGSVKRPQENEGPTSIFGPPTASVQGEGFGMGKSLFPSFRVGLMAAAAILFSHEAAVLLLGDNPFGRSIFSDISIVLINAAVTSCLFYAAYCSKKAQRNDFYAWTILAIGMLSSQLEI